MLMNNVPPQYDRTTRSPQPRPLEDKSNLIANSYKQQEADDFGQLPKRTVSLGPRRLKQQQPPKAPVDTATSGFNNPSRFQRQDSRERAQSFNRMADALQSSLTELNKFIDTPPTPKIASDKAPKYTSYLTRPSDEPQSAQISYVREATTTGHDSPEAEQTVFDWRADLMNWKASTSMNDLRSVFESKPKVGPNLDLPPQSSATLRPPRSASPNFLKNSPWQNLVASNSSSSNSNTNLKVYPESDYTIRRTTSTQSRSNVPRNPYRSHYGQY